jgi:hypothetical protein
MTLAKEAQFNFDGFSLPIMAPKPTPLPTESLDPKPLDPEMPKPEELSNDVNDLAEPGLTLIEIDDEDPNTMALQFSLPLVPGGEDQSEFEPSDINVEEEEEVNVENDMWKWTIPGFLPWLQRMMNGIPRHSGRDSVGIERAISYLSYLDSEISKAARMDFKNEIDIDVLEKAREEIHKGRERLQDRLEKILSNKYPKKGKKKKAETENQLVKEAGTANITGIAVTVPLLISGIVRTCINSMVSAGKDIEDCFHKMAKDYDLTNREIFESIQLFSDMGYSVRRPRGYELDEAIDYTKTDNLDWTANYPG